MAFNNILGGESLLLTTRLKGTRSSSGFNHKIRYIRIDSLLLFCYSYFMLKSKLSVVAGGDGVGDGLAKAQKEEITLIVPHHANP